MKKNRKIIIAVTGASGSVYARQLFQRLVGVTGIELSVIVTDTGREVMEFEDTTKWLNHSALEVFDNHDMFSPVASGSAHYDAMVIVPCSMGTMGRIASGVSSDLLCRAADVMLKERRTLIIVPRESPLSTIHLRNMTTLSECGAIICPASPSFYSKPDSLEQLCSSITERIISLLGIEHSGFVWGE